MQIKQYKLQIFIINGATISCLIVILIGLLQAFNFNPLNIQSLDIAASTFVNKNHAAIYIEFFIPVLFLLLLYNNNPYIKVLYSTTLSLGVSFLYVLSSFGSFISVLLAILFSGLILSKYTNIFHLLKNNQRYLIAIIIGSVIVASTYTVSTKAEKQSFTSITHKSSHKQRLAVYIKSLNAIKDNPLTGFGYAGFRSGIIPYIAEVQSITKHNENVYFHNTHNDFLQQFTETGIINGILFLSFFIIILHSGLKSLPNDKISEKNVFIFSISSGLLVLILHAFIDFPFHLSVSNFLIYLTSGLILASTAKTLSFTKNYILKSIIGFIFISLTLLLVFSTYFNIKHILANKLLKNAAVSLQIDNNCGKAIEQINKSMQLFQFDFTAQVTQAHLYGVCPQTRIKQNAVITKLLYLNPTNFKARYLRANNYLVENDSVLALKDYTYIVEMLPNRSLGYWGMGKWAERHSKFNDAKIYYEQIKLLEPYNTAIDDTLKNLNEKIDSINYEK